MRQGLTFRLLTGACLLGLAQLACAADAADFPNKPVRIVVPFPAGGTADVLPRIVAEKLSQKWGQPVIVDNRTGAAGNIGADTVAKADPDGYTLMATPPAPLAINETLYRTLPFDPHAFVPVTVLAKVPNVLAVRKTLPVSTAAEFIAYARQNAGRVNVATQGNGTTSHLTGAMFESQAGVRFVFIPYKGTAPALADMLGGQVDAFFDNIASSYPHHKAGAVKILAVTGAQRSPLAPEIPTLAESGLPGFDATTWFAVAAPPETPADIVAKINAAIVEVLKMPDVQKKFVEQGAQVVGDTPKGMADFLAAERARWKKVIDAAQVTIN